MNEADVKAQVLEPAATRLRNERTAAATSSDAIPTRTAVRQGDCSSTVRWLCSGAGWTPDPDANTTTTMARSTQGADAVFAITASTWPLLSGYDSPAG